MKQKFKGITGIVIMFIAIISTYLWVTYGQAKLQSASILVAQNDIPKGTVITDASKYFKVDRVNFNSIANGALKPDQINMINGRIVENFIPTNGQIVEQSFSNNSLILKENEFIFKLPPTWVYTIPSSIRRGDEISIYEIDGKIENRLNAGESLDMILTKGKAESILETTVVFVKDSSNREVIDTDGNERLDGTSQVSAVEIICTREDTQIIENSIINGKKLVVVYR